MKFFFFLLEDKLKVNSEVTINYAQNYKSNI